MSRRRTETLEKLIDASRDLFSKKWFETVSVAEICREAGVSNGVFYRYFRNKKGIFEYQLNEIIKFFEREFNSIRGVTIEDRLNKFLDIVIESALKYRKQIIIYREAQYRFPEYEKRLRRIYITGISRIFNRDISEAEYLYIAGATRFINIRNLFNGKEYQKNQLKEIILNGIFYNQEVNFDNVFDEDTDCVDKKERDDTRNRLLKSGIELFGSKGYYNVNIYDIVKDAGYAIGTFYIYFNSKEEFLSTIVKKISKVTRRFITKNTTSSINRFEKELRGIYLFLKFFSQNKDYYEIVREAEFVVNKDVKDYYESFEKGYLKNLKDIKYNSNVLISNILMGISHYMGIEKFYLEKILDEKEIIKELKCHMINGIKK
ncbi:MAG: TetR/AcrR family transcriptional regulator [Thermotogota bacterium]